MTELHLLKSKGASAIDGAAVLDDTYEFLGRFVIYPTEHHRRAHALWCAHTHLMECWESTPRIYFKSPEPGSGKTRALEVCEYIVLRGFIAMNMSTAYLMRRLGERIHDRPTLLYDEIDTVFGPKAKDHEDIRGIINAGHRKSAVSGRAIAKGQDVQLRDFPAYAAVALAGLHDLPDTITTRAVVVPMKKRSRDEKVEPWRARTCEPQAQALGVRLAEWADTVRERAVDYFPEMPDGVDDRDADVWEALVSVADLAGGKWPELAREAAAYIVAESKESGGDSLGVLLLSDLQRIFKANPDAKAQNGGPAMRTQFLVKQLNEIAESPWKSMGKSGQGIEARGLATLLKSYEIKPKDIRWDDKTTAKGYWRNDFEDAWKRYVDVEKPKRVAEESRT